MLVTPQEGGGAVLRNGDIFGKNAFSDINFYWPMDQKSNLGILNFQKKVFSWNGLVIISGPKMLFWGKNKKGTPLQEITNSIFSLYCLASMLMYALHFALFSKIVLCGGLLCVCCGQYGWSGANTEFAFHLSCHSFVFYSKKSGASLIAILFSLHLD